MNEKHVTSLELSKRLKALGCPQKSEFEWCFVPAGVSVLSKEWLHKVGEPYGIAPAGMKTYSAFLASELGEMLPWFIKVNNIDEVFLNMAKDIDDWFIWYEGVDVKGFDYKWESITGKTEAEARGNMLAYLKEEKLI
jgi:hypothetical protein